MKNKNTVTLVKNVTDIPAATGYNVTLINDEGSYCSTQIWGRKQPAVFELEQFIRGEVLKGLNEKDKWTRPYIAVFICAMNDAKTTYEIRF